ncbi:dpr-interacting protein kappa isoform X2 [Musca autumnalis]|uniref:dpr-interacting protein kappa isoform X2 n=2 Tax=Musca autumnalis TaxID=221902 RepID=UPI003CE6E137
MKMNIITIIMAASGRRNMSVGFLHFIVIISCIILLSTVSVTATPEIPSKGKHSHSNDKSRASVEDDDMPRFAEPVANVTVSLGRDALLACVVENLKNYKVAWVRVDTQTILSIHHNVIIQNNRISLTYNDHRSWYLHIKEVDESDRGWYMCQVNTDPMRSRKGYLQVVVPPMIVEGMTSHDVVAREGLNVTLTCKARGYPEPYVMWRREDGEEMLIGGEHVNVVDGEHLHITKVSRLHMAAYLCVASNGVPPSISKRVNLRVQFPPMLSIPNQLEGAYIGQDVTLECHTEAYPASINYWTTERGDMIISDTSRAGDKYETASIVNGYMKHMKLKIRNVGPNDFGTYRCVAKNSLGETDGNIKLDEMPAPTTAILSEMAMLNRSYDGKRRNKNKLDSNSLPDYGVEEWRDGAGNSGDNNQSPMRNPPDAFHNSANRLAQNNPVGIIIQAIKMQSCGIYKRLTNLIQTLSGDGGGPITGTKMVVTITNQPTKSDKAAAQGIREMPTTTALVKTTIFSLSMTIVMVVAVVVGGVRGALALLRKPANTTIKRPLEYVYGNPKYLWQQYSSQIVRFLCLHECFALLCSLEFSFKQQSKNFPTQPQENYEQLVGHYTQQQHQETMRKNLVMKNEFKMWHDREMSPEAACVNEAKTEGNNDTNDEYCCDDNNCCGTLNVPRKGVAAVVVRCDKDVVRSVGKLPLTGKTMANEALKKRNQQFIDDEVNEVRRQVKEKNNATTTDKISSKTNNRFDSCFLYLLNVVKLPFRCDANIKRMAMEINVQIFKIFFSLLNCPELKVSSHHSTTNTLISRTLDYQFRTAFGQIVSPCHKIFLNFR